MSLLIRYFIRYTADITEENEKKKIVNIDNCGRDHCDHNFTLAMVLGEHKIGNMNCVTQIDKKQKDKQVTEYIQSVFSELIYEI